MPHSRMRNMIPAWALLVAAVGLAPPAQAGDSKVYARYNIAYNGLSIGTFEFRSNWTRQDYHLRAGARISLLNGMLFEWNARTESAGRLTGNGPEPKRYSFGYESGDDAGSVRLRFEGTQVSQRNVDPPPKKNRVPVRGKHMRDVIDPLSAVIGLSQFQRATRGRQSCDEVLEIFDGNMRYDIALSYKGTRQVVSTGYNGPAYVCRAKFRPIAGHKADKDEMRFLRDTNDIEVWLIPVRSAEMFVPYYIYLPLPIGSASMTTEEFHLESDRNGKLTVIGAR